MDLLIHIGRILSSNTFLKKWRKLPGCWQRPASQPPPPVLLLSVPPVYSSSSISPFELRRFESQLRGRKDVGREDERGEPTRRRMGGEAGGGANASWEISEQLRIWEEMRSFTQQTRCSKVPLQRRSKWKWPHSATRVYTGYKYSLWEIVLESNVKKGRTLNRMCSRSAVPCWQIQPSR